MKKRIAVALLTGAMALGLTSVSPASAAYRHDGAYHVGMHRGYGGYHRHYGYYHRGYGYNRTPCVPMLGVVSGNFCNGY